jgi:2,3-bisphosphoglycerate-independent phosphoglycerate mutase
MTSLPHHMRTPAPRRPARIVFIFLDGVGIGPPDPATNPLAAAELPALTELLGGPPVATARATAPAAPRSPPAEPPPAGSPPSGSPPSGSPPSGPPPAGLLVPLDATLGVAGLPQSGTGQTTLFTGVNAARRFGRHFGPWVPTSLRPLLRANSLLALARNAGLDIAFANAFPDHLPERAHRRGPAARTAPWLAAEGAGALTRGTDALRQGRAVASEIVNDAWRRRLGVLDLPSPSPADAGRTLAGIAARHDVTLFAHFTTDIVGHRGDFDDAVKVLALLDAFLAGVLDALPADALLVVASDHGNLEDARGGHTRNPALGVLAGPGAADIAPALHSLTDVTPALLRALRLQWTEPG